MLVSFEISLAWSYRESFLPMLQPYAIPDHVEIIEVEPEPERPQRHPAIV